MTANQINYAKLREEARSNLAKEQLTREANWETQRSNLAKENLTHWANEEQARHNTTEEALEKERNQLNYDASIYSSNVSQRNAELNYQSSIYSAQTNAATQQYLGQLNYATNMASIDQKTQDMWLEHHDRTYSADLNYNANVKSIETQAKGQKLGIVSSLINAVGSTATKFLMPIAFGAS